MPRVAFFLGISIYMYMDDHDKAHCHGIYGDYAGSFALDTGELLAGQMPPKQSSKIKSFIEMNREELMEKWDELSS